jgi:hypothetical protein
VKSATWQNAATGEGLTVTLKLDLTPELEAEGEAREVMRTIQNLRRKAGLSVDQPAKVEIPAWPVSWQAEIEEKTSTSLVRGDQVKLIV